jgi:Prion-inhibition and propagation
MTILLTPELPSATIESFKTAIDSFGTFHPKARDWNLPQKLCLTELGIEEARLLAWGDSNGVSGPSRLRVPPETPLSLPDLSDTIHGVLESIVSLQSDLHNGNHDAHKEAQKRCGLKSYAQTKYPEPTLDSARLEAFLQRQRRLKSTSQRGQHLKHYTVVDDVKFRAEYVVKVRNAIESLIALTQDDKFVEAAIQQDIKAMAWHPVFEEFKAVHDSQKLQMIRQSCKELYPTYSEAAEKALQHLNQEWQDNDEEIAQTQKPILDRNRWSSYQRKSISIGPGGLLSGEHNSNEKKEGKPKKDKHTAGVFKKLFRRRSFHLQQASARDSDEEQALEKNAAVESAAQEAKNAPRSMSV